jgi:FkbM family methyltransferase
MSVTENKNFTSYSQHKQDAFIMKNVFHYKHNLVFLDVGAYDGVSLSNTYILETQFGWNGLCIEPSPEAYAKLIQNRKCHCICAAASEQEGTTGFLLVNGNNAMLSGMITNLDARHEERIDKEIKLAGGNKKIITVPTIVTAKELENRGISHVHYASIDVEGGELAVLKGLYTSNITVDLLSIEDNYGDRAVKKFLVDRGYVRFARLKIDDLYIRTELLTFSLRLIGSITLIKYYYKRTARSIKKNILYFVKRKILFDLLALEK